MIHHHFLAAAAASAALIAFLNSPQAQQDMMNYLAFMEHSVYTLAVNLRNNVKSMTTNEEPQITYPKSAPMPNFINATDEQQNQTNGTNKQTQTNEMQTNKQNKQ